MNPTSSPVFGQRILIIDAHPVYIYRLESFFKGLTFHHVLLAKGGYEGLTLLAAEKPGVVIMSGTLPEMDAVELCRQVRAAAPSVKIIVQVGLLMDDKRAQFRESGADYVLDRKEKDFTPLEDAVMAALGLSPGIALQ